MRVVVGFGCQLERASHLSGFHCSRVVAKRIPVWPRGGRFSVFRIRFMSCEDCFTRLNLIIHSYKSQCVLSDALPGETATDLFSQGGREVRRQEILEAAIR